MRAQGSGETGQEELNRHLLQRLAEEATLVIEAQEAADTAIMAGNWLMCRNAMTGQVTLQNC